MSTATLSTLLTLLHNIEDSSKLALVYDSGVDVLRVSYRDFNEMTNLISTALNRLRVEAKTVSIEICDSHFLVPLLMVG